MTIKDRPSWQAIAADPTTELEDLLELAELYPFTVQNNVAVQLLQVEGGELWQEFDEVFQRKKRVWKNILALQVRPSKIVYRLL